MQMAKKKRKRKYHGHFCRMCAEYKSNEAFREKSTLSISVKNAGRYLRNDRNELQYINQIDRIAGKYPSSRQDWELLEKYSKNKKSPEAMEFAQIILDQSRKYSLPKEENEDGQADDLNELFSYC